MTRWLLELAFEASLEVVARIFHARRFWQVLLHPVCWVALQVLAVTAVLLDMSTDAFQLRMRNALLEDLPSQPHRSHR